MAKWWIASLYIYGWVWGGAWDKFLSRNNSFILIVSSSNYHMHFDGISAPWNAIHHEICGTITDELSFLTSLWWVYAYFEISERYYYTVLANNSAVTNINCYKAQFLYGNIVSSPHIWWKSNLKLLFDTSISNFNWQNYIQNLILSTKTYFIASNSDIVFVLKVVSPTPTLA